MIGEEDRYNYYPFFVAVQFPDSVKNYFFGTEEENYEIGEKVIVESVNGIDIAIVSSKAKSTSDYQSDLSLAPVIRRANKDDLRDYEFALKEAETALEITKDEVERLGLPMRLLSAHYTLDGSKCTIAYTADNRVDFRELLKVLAPQLHCRIELRQLAPRDKAKAIGGIGPCGLLLCCSTFLNSFDGISIARAKNQMLSLNIPKLSGACGKLLCCLAYEDDLYTEERKKFPKIGSIIRLKGVSYRVDSFNILSRAVRLVSDTENLLIDLDELNKKSNPSKEEATPANKEQANNKASNNSSYQNQGKRKRQ